MTRQAGEVKVEYDGLLPEELAEHLKLEQVRIAEIRPLTLISRRPEDVLNRIYRYLGNDAMKVRRVQIRGAA